MYLDLFDELTINKKLMKIAGLEVAVYWAQLLIVLRQVLKKHTANEQGSFILDREYMERETSLTLTKQLKCDNKLSLLGVLYKHPSDPNRLTISVGTMASVLSGETLNKIKDTSIAQKDKKAAKIAGIKASMKKAILETDTNLRFAYERWTDGMVDAGNCRFTKAVVQLFEKTVTEYSEDKSVRLKIIEIATASSLRDANWAIDRLNPKDKVTASTQKVYQGISDSVAF